MTPYLFPSLARTPWWRELRRLERALLRPSESRDDVERAHRRLLTALATARHADLAQAAAAALLTGGTALEGYAGMRRPAGLEAALAADLARLAAVAGRDYDAEVSEAVGPSLPPLRELAPVTPAGADAAVLDAALALLREPDWDRRLARYLELFDAVGDGVQALYPALRWRDGRLAAVEHPDRASWGELVGLDEQLARLAANTEALLRRRPTHHALLYGARGSGKSTAVRGLLERYAGSGLRLVELAAGDLDALPTLVERLRPQPTSFVVFVDDLAFEEGEVAYRPLKSLLEGSLARRPANVVVYATSNRRHLLRERHVDRPDPYGDDVHGWDTHNERLALADRFGLTLTFPGADQRRYLETVRALAALRGVSSERLSEEAVRFAEWGNGYSGRTARQFVDEALQRDGRARGDAAP